MSEENNNPFTEDYRPHEFSELVGQDHIKSRLEQLSKNHLKMPNLILAGPSGSGKTTALRIMTKKILGDFPVLEINASDDRGINVIRDKISKYVEIPSIYKIPYKIIHLEEADQLTDDAQKALRAVMENYTQNVRFILTCENVYKFIAAIRTRAGLFLFRSLSEQQLLEYLTRIIRAEKIKIKPEAARLICHNAEGSARNALNCLHILTLTQTEGSGIMERDVIDQFGFNQNDLALELLRAEDIHKAYFDVVYRGLSPRGLFNFMMEKIKNMDIDRKIKAIIMSRICEIDWHIADGAIPDIQIRAMLAEFQERGIKWK